MITYKNLGGLTLIAIAFIILSGTNCSSSKVPVTVSGDTLYTNTTADGWPLELVFGKGSQHNYPMMAVWITDTAGNYIETLYIAASVARGYFGHGDKSQGKWQPGPIRRPAALPVWAHQRNVREADGLYVPTNETAIPDAYTGATPVQNFVLYTKTPDKSLTIFDIYFEINQSWDWNEYWTNSKFPDDAEYKTSCQPALVYKARIDTRNAGFVKLDLIGHSSYNGSNGEITPDLSTMTTALQIVKEIKVRRLP